MARPKPEPAEQSKASVDVVLYLATKTTSCILTQKRRLAPRHKNVLYLDTKTSCTQPQKQRLAPRHKNVLYLDTKTSCTQPQNRRLAPRHKNDVLHLDTKTSCRLPSQSQRCKPQWSMTRRTNEVITHDRKTAWSATPDGTGSREGRGRGYWSNNDNGKLLGQKGGSRL